MKRILLWAVLVVSLSILPTAANAQNLQTYQGKRDYHYLVEQLKVTGIERYTYSVGERGERLIQGNYSFSGSDKISNNTNQLTYSYTISTTCKDGYINGTYASNGTVTGKTFYAYQGWKSSSCSTKFSGTFSNGKADGPFSVVIKDITTAKGSATLKKGKYIGAYHYESGDILLSGQLTTDGKLTGKWVWGNTNYVFENDVLILETTSNGVSTPPFVQQIAKQYAAGKLTKEQVEAKGLVVKTSSLPLESMLNDLIFRENDITGLQELPAHWDMSSYGAKEFVEILKLNTISDEGFDRVLGEIKKTNKYNAVYYELYTCKYGECQTFCNSELHYDESSDAYYMVCGGKFNQLYGYYHESYSTASEGTANIYVNNKQYNVLMATKDSVLIASAHDFVEIFNGRNREIEKLGRLYATYRKNADDLMARLPLDYNKINGFLNLSTNKYKYYVKALSSSTSMIRLTPDSTYIIDTDEYGQFAWKNELSIMDGFNEAMRQASAKADSLFLLQRELNNIQNSGNISGVKASIINQYTQHSKGRNLLSAYNSIIETRHLIELADSIERKNDFIIANVPENLLKNYKKEYKRVSSIKAKDTNITPSQYQELFSEISSLQEKTLKYNTQSQKAETLNNVISKKCSDFPDILKPWQAKYKSCTALTEETNKSLLKIEDVQKIGQNLLKYISLRQQCDSNSIAIVSMCGKQYGDVVKPYQNKIKGIKFVPDLTSIETLNKDYTSLVEFTSYQADLLRYIQNRQRANQLNQSILEKIVKTKNVKKLYGVFYKSLPITWSAESDNFSTITETISLLQKTEATLQSNGAESFDSLLKKAKTAEDFKNVLNL